jgi:L-cysteine:1D-myo-inositol 2-amino-2-deoxy-alpha-D-glucopyranoside ligase
MHVAMVSMDGHKMSKSRGNLVFVDKLRTEHDPMAIRLGLIEHHYRVEWEWDEGLMGRNQERLSKWRSARSVTKMTNGRTVLDDVRDALDDDLDTPAAVRMVDDAAQRGFDVRDAASLLGVLM